MFLYALMNEILPELKKVELCLIGGVSGLLIVRVGGGWGPTATAAATATK